MHLYIHAPFPDNAFVCLDVDGRRYRRVIPFKNGKRGDMLAAIDYLFGRSGATQDQLKRIAVVTGPGHFSYLRTSISLANTFGFALGIPVVGLTADQFSTEDEFIELAKKQLARRKTFKPLAPEYGKEPNISTPKKCNI